MSWLNRLKLLSGIVIIVPIVGLLTLLFSQWQNQVASITAHVDAPRTVVTSPYGGLITDQKRGPGDHVSAGDQLFTVISSNLRDMAALEIKPINTDGYEVDLELGTITFYVTIDGYLESFTAFEGSYVSGSERLAEIVSSKNKTVVTMFQLNPSDYGRIEQDSKVATHLPDGQLVEGRVMSVNIGADKASKKTVIEVTVASDGLQAGDLMLLTRRNTPVNTVMSLRDDGPLVGPTQTLHEFLVKIGLR